MKSGFKRFLPAFMLGMFSGMAASQERKAQQGRAQLPGTRKGKSKGGRKGRGFLTGLPHKSARGTALGAAMIQYKDTDRYGVERFKYARPNEEGMRELMEPNWHRSFMGKTR